MTASGTYTFTLDASEIMAEAWERCGKDPATLEGWQTRSARKSLNLMFIDWSNSGASNLWAVERQTLALTAGTDSYTLPVGTVDVIEANLFDGSTETVLTMLTRDQYAAIPVKTTQARSSQFWVERILPLPVIHLYATPDQAYTLIYYRIRQLQDIGGMTETLDAPALWLEAICAGLAARLAQKWVPEREVSLGQAAAMAYAKAAGETRERAPFTAQPNMSFYQ
ncbi:hypothetical protein ABNQ39_00185 (plasmid) [Azospirillum sp. A26]|uniref:phage adaptor protein n=1 Tax=Azospirillum sp. A26 TaxID=3160607 RepID=UPI0036720212